MDTPTSLEAITPDDFSAATSELRAAEVTHDFALTPARLPWSAYHAMRSLWRSFSRGVEAFIDMHERDFSRIASALFLPEYLIPIWDCLPPHDWAMIARPDVIIAEGSPLIIDVNASSLSGHFATNDMLLRAHRAPELRGYFSNAGEPRFLMGHYADLLRRFCINDKYMIGLTYFAEEDAAGPSKGRFHYLTEIMELGRLGLSAQMVHIEDIDVTSSGVYCRGERIGLIHRYFTPRHDDAAQIDQLAKVAKAARDGLVVVWTGLSGDVFDSKTMIATLSDERFTSGLRPSLAAAMSRWVPWTRLVEERHTLWRDDKIDLIAWIAENRARLVLKPAIGGMGRSVIIGQEASASDWEAQLASLLRGGGPWVVQELLRPDHREVKLADQAGVIHAERGPVVYGVFVLDGEFVGAICRHGRRGYSELMINGLTGAVPTPVYWSG